MKDFFLKLEKYNNMSDNKKSVGIIVTLIFLSIALVTFCGYISSEKGEYKGLRLKEVTNSNEYKMSYVDFQGTKNKKINLKNNDKVEINVLTSTKDGKLTIKLLEDDTEVFKIKTPEELKNYTLKVKDNSNYKIKVEGNHSGAFHITWRSVS